MSVSGVKLEGSGVGGRRLGEHRFEGVARPRHDVLRLDMADDSQANGGAGERGDQRPAGEQFGRCERKAGVAIGEALGDRQMAKPVIPRDRFAIADRAGMSEPRRDAEQRAPRPSRALAHLRGRRRRFRKAIDRGDLVHRLCAKGAAQQQAIHRIPAMGELLLHDVFEVRRALKQPIRRQAFDAPGKGEAAGRKGAVAILQKGERHRRRDHCRVSIVSISHTLPSAISDAMRA